MFPETFRAKVRLSRRLSWPGFKNNLLKGFKVSGCQPLTFAPVGQVVLPPELNYHKTAVHVQFPQVCRRKKY
jgi:hypothetical protein